MTPQSFIVLISFITTEQCCSTTEVHCTHFIFTTKQCCGTTKLHCHHSFSSHSTMLWHHRSSLYSFYFFLYSNAVIPQSFIVLILFLSIQQCWDTTKLHCISSQPTMLWYQKASLSSFYFFPYNNAVAPQSFIVLILFLPIQQCCDTIKLHCTHLIYHYAAMLWHNKASLYSFHLLPYNNAGAPQSFIVLILFLPMQQFCNTTKLHCISSYPTMLWHHKASLYLFYFFPYNNAVTPQSFIVLILFLPIQQCCDTTKLHCAHSISSHTTMM